MTLSDIRALLEDWGRWHRSGNGYPGAAIMPSFGRGRIARSRNPRGTEMSPAIADLIRARDRLIASRAGGEAMAAIYARYVSPMTLRSVEWSPDQFRVLVARGEEMLRLELSGGVEIVDNAAVVIDNPS